MKKTFANILMKLEYEIFWTLIVSVWPDCKPKSIFCQQKQENAQYAGSFDINLKAMIVDKSKTSQFTESCSQSGFRENTAAAGRGGDSRQGICLAVTYKEYLFTKDDNLSKLRQWNQYNKSVRLLSFMPKPWRHI